ncbi:hypothetical protein ACFPYN_02940 [Paenisporosarcina macmurdoensis]|uniref:Uncharacterized protein n=1 Tax=Paenisporosarcina macmurdoensis TaxID=212659 RepID=A0ABW1L5L3_9BACL
MHIDIDRDQLVCTITMLTNYSDEYLKKISDIELLEIYSRVMDGRN